MQVLTIVLLMICNGQNPGSLTSGTSHNKFSKMPPPTSMHLWTRCRLLRVARRSSWRRSFIRKQALLMRATRSARVSTLERYTSPFSHPHKQKSKGVSSFYHISVTVQNRTHVHMKFLLRITHTIISQSIADSSWITLYAFSFLNKQYGKVRRTFSSS
jgi:hypothetical protein